MNQFSRSELLFGQIGMQKIAQSRIAVFGIGGVGGAAAEALVRSGIGAIDVFDADTISLSNLNRQVIATHKTIGRDKIDVMKERLLGINPNLLIKAVKLFYLPENANQVDLSLYDYIVDAVDTVKAKLELVVRAWQLQIPIISAMGAGNKLDATKLVVCDIYKTSGCPLARVMRSEMRKRGIPKLKVVYSTENPIKPIYSRDADGYKPDVSQADSLLNKSSRRVTPGSSSFVPPMMGLIIAGEILREIAAID
ncbi:MAG: tRNA threonylcarbamoyladenosine dehydratase [Clostridiales bacterium]|nr:tRNA threonylcarbamoyladenosine dehydratase [Clostridiales bacterium]